MNSYQRYQDEKMRWGDRSADGDWADPDPYDRRYRSDTYQSPFKTGSTAADSEYYSSNWVERPHYSN
eukprot:1804804-Amphidinium_carterae.1